MWYDESKLRQNQVLVVTDTNVLGRIPKIVALNNAVCIYALCLLL